jgi:hypothetical protein
LNLPVASQSTKWDRAYPLLAWLWWCAFAVVLAILMVPILVVEVPPLTDYPNHLARSVILAFSPQDPVLQRMFAVH